MRDREIAIVGYSETKIEYRSGRHVFDFAGEAMARVIEQTGIEKPVIDGLALSSSFSDTANPFQGPVLAGYLGLELNWCQTTDLGGGSCTGNVARAAAAIRAGLCEVALVLAADAESTENKANIGLWRTEWQFPVGTMGPPGSFGLLQTRYREQYGLDDNALAKLAVTQRNHALLNDLACDKLRKPITAEDYLNSPMISTPIRLLDCVMVCDGANAVLVTSTRRARELGLKKMVHPIGYGERVNFQESDPCPDITLSGHSVVGPKALAQAGLTTKDIQMIHPYDDFLIAILMQLEHIGFCNRGQGSSFVKDTDLRYNGTLPLNTGGGQISAGQAGLAGGGHNLVEAVRQLFGDAGARQVKNPRNALVTGIGWIPYARNWAVNTALVLEAA